MSTHGTAAQVCQHDAWEGGKRGEGFFEVLAVSAISLRHIGLAGRLQYE